MAPPSPSRSGVDHPAVQLQYDLAKLIFSRAGVPQQNDTLSWASFIQPFKETPYPADDNAASLLAERLSREAGAFVSSFKLMRSFSSGKASGKGRAPCKIESYTSRPCKRDSGRSKATLRLAA